MKKHRDKNRGIHVGTFVTEAGRPVGTPQIELASLKRKAESGDVAAQNELGGRYAYGRDGAPRDPAAALKWLGKAAEQGLPLAVGNLGYAHLHGLVGPADAEKALVLIRRAEAEGDVHARCHLAYAYLFGVGVAKDEARAAELYRIAAEQGHVRAMTNLADLLRNGIGVLQDDAEALALARKGAGLGDPTAMLILGDLYLAGRGGAGKDATTAAGWYRNAAGLGSPDAQERMGRLLESGKGIPLDLAGAVKWYELAAGNGQPSAARRLAEMLFYGVGVPKHVLKATDGFRRAAELGDACAARTMGNLAATGCGGVPHSAAQAAQWYLRAAEAGDAMSRFLLGEAYENGEGVAASPTDADGCFRRAAEQRHKGAEHALLTPHPPLPPVSLKAMPPQSREAWFRARNGDAACMAWAGGQFATGKGGFPISEEEAQRWFEMASDTGDKTAILLLASFHSSGTGVPKDLDKAVRLLLPLAEKGHTAAQRELGRIYEAPGAPGRRPYLEAAKWAACAAEKGDDATLMNDVGNTYFTLAKKGPHFRTPAPGQMPALKSLVATGWYALVNAVGLSRCRDESYGKALQWYRKAADKGYAQAFTNLGDYAFLGLVGVPKDEADAFRFYSRAARLGDWHADVNMGVMLHEGWGCGRDVAKGLETLKRAEAAGSAMAWQLLSIVYKETPACDVSVRALRERSVAASREFSYPAAERKMPGFVIGTLKAAVTPLLITAAILAAAVWGIVATVRCLVRVFS